MKDTSFAVASKHLRFRPYLVCRRHDEIPVLAEPRGGWDYEGGVR
jgi:hypothetical protein